MACSAFNLASFATSLPTKQVKSSCSAFNGGLRIRVVSNIRGAKCRGLEISSMAKREDELVELRKLTDEDIGIEVVDLKGELFLLRAKQATRQEYKSSEFRRIRKRVARMLTIRRERELERGVSLRESRKLDRAWKKSIVIRPPPSLEASLVKAESK